MDLVDAGVAEMPALTRQNCRQRSTAAALSQTSTGRGLSHFKGPPIKNLKETNKASGSSWTRGRARRTATSFGKLKEQDGRWET
jgi:hypothetical protein